MTKQKSLSLSTNGILLGQLRQENKEGRGRKRLPQYVAVVALIRKLGHKANILEDSGYTGTLLAPLRRGTFIVGYDLIS